MARWAHHQGAQVSVHDTRPEPPQAAALRQACPGVVWHSGPWAECGLDDVDMLAWSQGVSPHEGESGALYAAAQARGLPVWGELEFFARELACWRAQGHETQVLAITGTNGKTTTTRLVGHVCQHAGRFAVVAGNISPPVLEALYAAHTSGSWPALWVLEVASYQLVLAESFAPDVAALLNITEDHLDWHGTMSAYIAAKQRVFAAARVQIYNRDDARTAPPAGAPGQTISFGLDAPRQAPGFGIVQEGGLDWLAEAVTDETEPSGRRRRTPAPWRVKTLMPVGALPLAGAHNHANVLAALALARAAGLPMASLLHGLRSFQGEPHRCQRVAVLHDVEWYDDSKGTNVGATVAALSGLGRPVVLIAGGDGKGQNFAPLAPAVARHARAVLLIGRDASRIRAALAETGVALENCSSLEAAVARAAALAEPGSAVLLSPACASWDMFRDYAHRAEVFVTAVQRLAWEAGQPC
jgi:UDP-N-acetylmuramoylalanine--D-glutamate ligase